MTGFQLAVRSGALYESRGVREISIIRNADADVIDAIQRFRGHAYGPCDAVIDGRNAHPADAASDHVLLLENGELIGCARFERRAEEVEFGGFVVAERYRRGRATQAIAWKVREYALASGVRRFVARASVEFGSSSLLQKFGARVLATYYEPAYRRHVELLEFRLDDTGQLAA